MGILRVVVLIALSMTCFLPELVRAKEKDLECDALLTDATRSAGPEYFALKKQLCSADPTAAQAANRMQDKNIGWSQRLVALAIWEDTMHARENEKAMEEFYVTVNQWPRAPRPRLYEDNPKLIAKNSPDATVVKDMRQWPLGFLYEIMFKHTSHSLLDASADVIVRRLNATGETAQRPNGRWIREGQWDRDTFVELTTLATRSAAIFTPELKHARVLACRALILDGSDDAIAMLEQAATQWDTSLYRDAVRSLTYIDSIASRAAIARLPNSRRPETFLKRSNDTDVDYNRLFRECEDSVTRWHIIRAEHLAPAIETLATHGATIVPYLSERCKSQRYTQTGWPFWALLCGALATIGTEDARAVLQDLRQDDKAIDYARNASERALAGERY
jgi:hypothetical protein